MLSTVTTLSGAIITKGDVCGNDVIDRTDCDSCGGEISVNAMWDLLCLYSTNKNPDTILTDYGNDGFTKHDIKSLYVSVFGKKSFHVTGTCIIPQTAEITSNLETLDEVIEKVGEEINMLHQRKRELIKKRACVRQAQKGLEYSLLSPEAKAVDIVHKFVSTQVTRNLGADGDVTNGCFTQDSCQRLLEMLRDDFNMNSFDVFLDGGSAYNVFVCHATQVLGCKAWGIEISAHQCWLGATNFSKLLTSQEKSHLVNTQIGYVMDDLLNFKSFEPTTVAYFFDEAFVPSLVESIVEALSQTQSLRLVVLFKASKTPSIHNVYHEHGFRLLNKRLNLFKQGSGESNTMYLYKRVHSSACGGTRKKDWPVILERMWRIMIGQKVPIVN